MKCFIRKNTPELIDKIKAIGDIDICKCVWFDGWTWLDYTSKYGLHGIAESDEYYEDNHSRFIIENPDHIDCGENEELFLTLIGMEENPDEATIQEIIDHFKNK